MAHPVRTLLLTLALGFGAAALPTSIAGAAPAQDPGATFGTGETTTTLAVTTTVSGATTTEAPSGTNQTLVESEDQPEKAIFTESRKVAAVIGGLVFVALAILLLTIRYIRTTKPVAPGDISDLPMLADDVELDDDQVFVVGLDPKTTPPTPVVPTAEPETTPDVAAEAVPVAPATEPVPVATGVSTASEPAASAPATDHDGADADWEPRTDEHQRVEIPAAAALVRPSTAARRKALGVSD